MLIPGVEGLFFPPLNSVFSFLYVCRSDMDMEGMVNGS